MTGDSEGGEGKYVDWCPFRDTNHEAPHATFIITG